MSSSDPDIITTLEAWVLTFAYWATFRQERLASVESLEMGDSWRHTGSCT